MPKISIITITYNRAKYLPEAIESVLAQSFSDWELLIIDDASTDNTKEIASAYEGKDLRIRYYKNETNLRISRSRNRGIELAKGKYVAMLDSDDVWKDKDKLRKQFDFMEANIDHGLVGGGVAVIDEQGREINRYLNPATDDEIRSSILAKNPFAQSSVMYLRQAVKDLGAYDVELNGIEDYDLWMRIGIKHKFANLADYVLGYRVHGGNISLTDRSRLMERNLFLVKRYRAYYPNYGRAILRRTIRLWGFRLISKFLKSI